MGRAQPQPQATIPSNNNNLYPQELQLKLYQAFIFSIPILFSIILFLLFYLFYLKKRASNFTSHPTAGAPSQLSASNQAASFLPSASHVGIKGDLKDELQVVHFDEELSAKDSQCCVCLGEFELKEELRQVPACKHVFHFDCIRSWLRNNATCPLCRCHVIISAVKQPPQQGGGGGGDGGGGSLQGQGLVVEVGSNMADFPTGDIGHVLHIEQSNEGLQEPETVR